MLKIEGVGNEFKASLGGSLMMPGRDVLLRVEKIWDEEQSRFGKKLHNGKLFSICSYGDGGVTGNFADYSWFIAQRRDPSLFQFLKIRPLAVTGVLLCDDGVVVGQRSENVEQDAGLWEFVPSGSVDNTAVGADGGIDLRKALLIELVEETGITENALCAHPEPFVVVEDLENHVTDVGFFIHISMTENEVRATFENQYNREYEALDILPIDKFLDGETAHLSKLSYAITEKIKPVIRKFKSCPL